MKNKLKIILLILVSLTAPCFSTDQIDESMKECLDREQLNSCSPMKLHLDKAISIPQQSKLNKQENTTFEGRVVRDQTYDFDSSFVRHLSSRIKEERVEVKGWANLTKKLVTVKLDVKHDIYVNHPESQFSHLGEKPRKLKGTKFIDWYGEFKKHVFEKPLLDAATLAMANIENLMNKDYQKLYEQSEKALKRNLSNQEARIQNFIARYYLNKDLEKHAPELYQLRLELMKTEVTEPAFSIMFGMLYSYFNGLEKPMIHDCVATNRFDSLLEEFSMKLIDFFNEKEDFAKFHADLLCTPDHLYLFWVSQCLADNAKILHMQDKQNHFPNLKQFVEGSAKLTDLNIMRELAYELCCVEKNDDLNVEWQLCKNLSKALLYFALFEIEDEYSRAIYK